MKVYNEIEVIDLKYKEINKDDEIWTRLSDKLPRDNNDRENEKLLLINAVVYLLSKVKGQYSLQLKWKELEGGSIKSIFDIDNDVEEEFIKSIKIDSLRKKFDRWRNDGIWERLLPVFQKSKYVWITNDGTYEVLLICSKFIRDKHMQNQDYIAAQKQLHDEDISNIKSQHYEAVESLKKQIREKESTIRKLKFSTDIVTKSNN